MTTRVEDLRKQIAERLGGSSINAVIVPSYNNGLIMELLLHQAGVLDEFGFFKKLKDEDSGE
jgi:hypothetical protein